MKKEEKQKFLKVAVIKQAALLLQHAITVFLIIHSAPI